MIFLTAATVATIDSPREGLKRCSLHLSFALGVLEAKIDSPREGLKPHLAARVAEAIGIP